VIDHTTSNKLAFALESRASQGTEGELKDMFPDNLPLDLIIISD
jgi:hypothetical protein